MSRRYPTAELYEQREKDFYSRGRSDRNYEELDIELRRGMDPRRSAPDFFRDDFDRQSNAGQLVVRDRRDDDVVSSRGARSRRGVEEESLVIRGGRGGPPPPSSVREVERDDITIRHSDVERRRPRDVDREETDITIRRREPSRPRGAEVREVEREDIVFRRGDGARPRTREVDFEREDIRFQERAPPSRRRGETEKEEITFRHEHREDSRNGRERDVHKDSLVIRGRERSLPPPRASRGDLVAREHEEFIIRRRHESISPSPPPPPRREVIKDEIIIRRREERSPSPAPAPPPPPPPPPEPEIRPPIIQEIITHHRHIDHGVERARSPTPPPPPPSPPRDESLEISIRRRESRGRGFEDEITFERETIERRGREQDLEVSTRRRSFSAPRRSRTAPPVESDFELEAEYYNRKAMERAYPGEAWNGATKDWAIVDVPPGTNRVRMDGLGGGGQEITWQRYNGVRRSKFMSGDDELATDFGAPAPPKPKSKDMWTEITKDLVLKDAIIACGYDHEETDDFFYVMEYLKYEDVLHLVEISDDIRRKRKSRIRQIEFEREEVRDRRPPSGWDERYYEHDVTIDRQRSRYR